MLSTIIICGIGYVTVKNYMSVISDVIAAETKKDDKNK